MGVPIDVMAALWKAIARAGVKNIHQDDHNAIIVAMSPIFEPGYDARVGKLDY